MTTKLDPRLKDVIVVASVSGGKDSAAMSLHLKELGIEHRRVFLDTGWEADETYDYVRGELARVLGPIEEVRGPRDMEALVRHKQMFPSHTRRFCTELLKVVPMQRYIHALYEQGREVVNVVGIRAEESAARAAMTEWEQSDGFDCWVWRPLLRWSFDDVVAIHKRHGLAPNPLYMLGASRVGCWPCFYARKEEIVVIAKHTPARIGRLRVLEHDVTRMHEDAATARGEEPDRAGPGGVRRAWFQSRLKDDRWLPTSIDEVVKWANTARGGKQYQMFAPDPAEQGCMRWGLCETDAKDD